MRDPSELKLESVLRSSFRWGVGLIERTPVVAAGGVPLLSHICVVGRPGHVQPRRGRRVFVGYAHEFLAALSGTYPGNLATFNVYEHAVSQMNSYLFAAEANTERAHTSLPRRAGFNSVPQAIGCSLKPASLIQPRSLFYI